MTDDTYFQCLAPGAKAHTCQIISCHTGKNRYYLTWCISTRRTDWEQQTADTQRETSKENNELCGISRHSLDMRPPSFTAWLRDTWPQRNALTKLPNWNSKSLNSNHLVSDSPRVLPNFKFFLNATIVAAYVKHATSHPRQNDSWVPRVLPLRPAGISAALVPFYNPPSRQGERIPDVVLATSDGAVRVDITVDTTCQFTHPSNDWAEMTSTRSQHLKSTSQGGRNFTATRLSQQLPRPTSKTSRHHTSTNLRIAALFLTISAVYWTRFITRDPANNSYHFSLLQLIHSKAQQENVSIRSADPRHSSLF